MHTDLCRGEKKNSQRNMTWLRLVGVFVILVVIAWLPNPVTPQSDILTTGLTAILATTAITSLGYSALCLSSIWRTVKMGKNDGTEDGRVAGYQAGEEECMRRFSASSPSPLDCEDIAARVNAITQREIDEREAQVLSSQTGYKLDTRNIFTICLNRGDNGDCSPDDAAQCTIKQFGSATFCIPTRLD